MKKLLLFLAILFVPNLARAQTNLHANLTTAGTSTSYTATSGLCMNLSSNIGSATIDLDGTWAGTVSFYGAVSGNPLVAISSVQNSASLTTQASSSTANGAWQFSVGAYSQICAIFTTATSGTVVTTIQTATPSARGNGGGGGAPSGAAGGDLGSTYPNPTVVATHLASALPVAQGGTGLATQTSNVIYKGNGTGGEQISSATDDGSSFAVTEVISSTVGFNAISDGVHGGYTNLYGNTANYPVTGNTAGFMGPNLASFTGYALQLPSTGPTTALPLLSCVTPVSSVSACSFVSPGTGTTFPLTVAGTVTSGGIPYFNSTTQESSSGILNANFLVKGGGAGAAPTNSLCSEVTSVFGCTEMLLAGANGVDAGYLQFAGNTANYTVAANTFGIMGPNLASFTGYAIQYPSSGPSATSFLQQANVSSGVSAGTYVGVSGSGNVCLVTSCMMVTPTLGAASATSLTLTGTTAGFVDFPQGTTSAAVAPCNTATSICEQAPTAVTSYLVTKPGVSATGITTNNVSAAVITQGFSGDANHSATVTTGSGTSVGSTTLCSSANCPAGTYVVHVYIDVTTACGTSGTYVVNLIYTDDQGAKTIPVNINGTGAVPATGVLTTTSTANFGESSQVIRLTSGNLNYSTTAVACGTAGPMVGKLYLAATPVM